MTSMVDAEGRPAADQEVLLEASGLTKYFIPSDSLLDRVVGSTSTVQAVDGIDLTLRRGETLAVVGESGCGKSTLGRTLLNLHQPTEGTVRFEDEVISGLSQRQMKPYRRRIQMIFQDPLASLNPRQTIGDIIRAPMEVHGIGEGPAERDELVGELLERVGLDPAYVDRYPQQFSGGQQQRIGIARAISVEPDLLVADEPVSSLDVSVQSKILNLLDSLQEELDMTMLFISHDLSVVRHISDRVAVMYLGEIVESARTDELFSDPAHPYTRSLLSAVPRIRPEKRSNRVLLQGDVPSPLDPPTGCRFHTRCPAVIPPDDWSGTQEAFRQAFTFRLRVEEEDLEPEAIRARLESDGGPADDDAVADYLIETRLPGSVESLPGGMRRVINEAADAVVAGERSRAESMLADEVSSVCHERRPERVDVASNHTTSCHRFDPGVPGDERYEIE